MNLNRRRQTLRCKVLGFFHLPASATSHGEISETEQPGAGVLKAFRRFQAGLELLRRNVALDVNWDEFGESPDAGRLLTMWGLNRVFGGIAFACLDPSRLDELALGLSRIRIVLRYDVDKCCASYENGVLELGLIPNCWADRGCYEHEIAAALTGQSAPQEVQEEAKPKKAAKAKKKTKRGR